MKITPIILNEQTHVVHTLKTIIFAAYREAVCEKSLAVMLVYFPLLSQV